MLPDAMAHVRQETADRLRQRVCLACGYRGPEVQQGYPADVFVCPSCGCDLYARPPRSYAEMEQIGAAPRMPVTPGVWPSASQGQTRRTLLGGLGRWVRDVLTSLLGSSPRR